MAADDRRDDAAVQPAAGPLFWAASRRREALAAFLGGYVLVWSVFGLAAFAGDGVVHALVRALPALEERPWLIAGGVLVTAGAFQFTPLKDACLEECRHPAIFLMRNYRRGTRAAFRLGRDHGIFCLGCCWALMLVMFAAGFANLVVDGRARSRDGVREDRPARPRAHARARGRAHGLGRGRARPSAWLPSALGGP